MVNGREIRPLDRRFWHSSWYVITGHRLLFAAMFGNRETRFHSYLSQVYLKAPLE